MHDSLRNPRRKNPVCKAPIKLSTPVEVRVESFQSCILDYYIYFIPIRISSYFVFLEVSILVEKGSDPKRECREQHVVKGHIPTIESNLPLIELALRRERIENDEEELGNREEHILVEKVENEFRVSHVKPPPMDEQQPF